MVVAKVERCPSMSPLSQDRFRATVTSLIELVRTHEPPRAIRLLCRFLVTQNYSHETVAVNFGLQPEIVARAIDASRQKDHNEWGALVSQFNAPFGRRAQIAEFLSDFLKNNPGEKINLAKYAPEFGISNARMHQLYESIAQSHPVPPKFTRGEHMRDSEWEKRVANIKEAKSKHPEWTHKQVADHLGVTRSQVKCTLRNGAPNSQS